MKARLPLRVTAAVAVLGGTVVALARPNDVALSPVPLGQNQQSEVTIVMSNPAYHPRVGVPDFLSTTNDAELATISRTIADVLWRDLQFEREFYMIPRASSTSIPSTPPEAIPYERWAELGADAVLHGSVSRNGADLVVDIRLITVKGDARGRQTFGARYPNCRAQNPRGCAHAIADDVHKQVRGLDGVARTKIAFASDRHGSRVAGRPSQTAAASKEIYISDYDGANPMRVTVNGSLNCCPAWSAAGNLLSYVSWQSGLPDIYVANLAQPGRPARPTASNVATSNWTPAWSPDGTRLAFASPRSGNVEIYVVNRDGTGLQNITNSPSSDDGAPTWSPNGAQIAFTSNRAGVNQLYIMNATGTGVQRIVSEQVDRPTWSSLNFIAFTVGAGPGHDVAIYDFANPGVKVLTDGVGSNESPAVAPNGRHIAFVTTRWGRQHIATIDRTGENLRQVTEAGNNTYPNWQPISR
ncbi:MAG: PD40 domain-containing protein [Acidobacteria bacterium]|nr:PD40 domain-containing protein [Acidobacteriota bacterium]